MGTPAMGTGTWQRRQRPDARYLSPGRGGLEGLDDAAAGAG